MKRWSFVVVLVLYACQGVDQKNKSIPNPPVGPLSQGTDVGSAGENRPEEYLAAWFVGNVEPVRACLEVARDFGVSETKVRSLLNRAFVMWRTYLSDRQVPLTTKFKVEDHCDESIDIVFYFGLENERVIAAKKQFKNPTAFVQPTFFDRKIPKGRGFVWIAKQAAVRAAPAFPDWGRPGRLLAILLHEIGHVHGTDHVPGTVMAENISDFLDSNWPGLWLAEINHCRDLAPCLDCTYETSDGTKIVMDRDGFFDLGTKLKRDFHHKVTRVFKVVHGPRIHSRFNQSFIQYASLPGTGKIGIEYNMAGCEPGQKNDRTPVHINVLAQ